jgi:hypothetical protein
MLGNGPVVADRNIYIYTYNFIYFPVLFFPKVKINKVNVKRPSFGIRIERKVETLKKGQEA